MKKSIIFAATILLLTMASCNKDSLTPSDAPLAWNGGTRAEKDLLDEIDFSTLDTAYFVTDKDVDAYVHFKELLAKGQEKDFDVLEVVPMGLNDKATLAYFLSYNEGWEIISADKRAPLLLGFDEQEKYTYKEFPKERMAWIEGLEFDVLFLRTYKGRPDVADDETWDNMLRGIDFWKMVSADKDYIERDSAATRINPILDPEPDPDLYGHWVVESTTSSFDVLTSTGPLLTTNFSEGSPYNYCCPKLYPGGPYNGKAGSIAVAGAQLAYYFHNLWGVPEFAPSSGSCSTYVADVNNWQGISVGDYSSTVWSQMLSTPQTASYLIAEIGKLADTNYKMNFSDGVFDGIIAYFQTNNSMTCSSIIEYFADSMKVDIQNNIPVVIHAIGYNGVDRKFVSDGYRRIKPKTITYYRWVWDVPCNLPHEEYRTVTTYGSITNEMHINWGMGTNNNSNSSWYSTSGNWSINGNNYYDGENRFRKMIRNFGPGDPIQFDV